MKLLCVVILAFFLHFCNSTIQVQDTKLCVLDNGIRRLTKPIRTPRARSPKFPLEIHEPETVTLPSLSMYPDETVLIIVDAQRDFCDDYPKATLPVPGAREVVARINDVRRKGSWKTVWGDGAPDAYEYLMIIRTEDTHPADHISFTKSEIWKNKLAIINGDGETKSTNWRQERIRDRAEYMFDVVRTVDGGHERIQNELTARKNRQQQQATQSGQLPQQQVTTTNNHPQQQVTTTNDFPQQVITTNDLLQQPAPTIGIPPQTMTEGNPSVFSRINSNDLPESSAATEPPPARVMAGVDITDGDVLSDLSKASDEFLNQCLGTAVNGQVKVTSQVQMYLWPVHCVVGTVGQESHPELVKDPADIVVAKGVFKYRESLSGVVDYDKREESNSKTVNALVTENLANKIGVTIPELLEMNRINILHLLKDKEERIDEGKQIHNVKQRDIETIVIVGFAFEYCVYETAMSLAKQKRWDILIVVDAVGYLLPKILRQAKVANLIAAGVKFVRSTDIVLPVGPKHTLASVSEL